MPKTVDTVERERERERVNSRELGFICCAQNTVLAGIRKIELNRLRIENKDGLCSNIKVVM